MIYRLRKSFRFEASHILKNHDGKCARLHGHSWTGYVEIKGDRLAKAGPKENMLMDYGDLGKFVDALEKKFDHFHLNDILETDMPTSEAMASRIWRLWGEITMAPEGVKLSRVMVSETCTTGCILEAE